MGYSEDSEKTSTFQMLLLILVPLLSIICIIKMLCDKQSENISPQEHHVFVITQKEK